MHVVACVHRNSTVGVHVDLQCGVHGLHAISSVGVSVHGGDCVHGISSVRMHGGARSAWDLQCGGLGA